jgi:hypothetical protein
VTMINDGGRVRGGISSAGAEKKDMRVEKSASSVDSFWDSTDGETTS